MLRRLRAGKYDDYLTGPYYSCPFRKGIAYCLMSRAAGGTYFNTLLKHAEATGSGIHKGGKREIMNINAYITEHRALGIHLRNLQRVAIKEGRMPPIRPKAPKSKKLGSKKWRKHQREMAEARALAGCACSCGGCCC